MNKYLGSAIVGILASGLIVYGQSGGAGGAAGGAAGGGAAGAGVSAGSPAGAAAAGRAGVAAPGSAAAGSLRGGNVNTIGAAGINQPSANPPVGGGTAIGAAPNTAAGASITQQSPGEQTASGVGGALPATGVFPAGSGVIGSPNAGTTAGNLGTASTLGNAQAGLPLSTLPPTLQQSIQGRLGDAQLQTISRDDLANGSVFRVTAMQNGVATEYRFAANGTFLGSTALPGTATSFVTPGFVTPASAVVLDTLPAAVQSTIRGQAGTGTIGSIVPQGQGYLVTYHLNGRPTTMLIAPDGRILRAGPTAVGTPPATSTGAGGSVSTNQNNRTGTNNTSSLQMDELPDEVRATLQREAADARVQFINREQRAGGEVYVVGGRTGDDYLQLTIDADGRIIRDTRDVPVVAIGSAPSAQEDISSGIPFSRVPVAIQNAVKAFAAASEVRSVNLGLANGKTVYDVVYLQDGRRNRMIVAKDGSVLRQERDVPPALDNSTAPPKLAIGDLPTEVQDTIRRQTDTVLVKEIGTKRLADELVYSIRYETNGAPVELLVNSSGTVIVPSAGEINDLASAPRPAPVPRVEEEPVRVVNAAPDTDSVGTAASVESRLATSNETARPTTAIDAKPGTDEAPVQSVALSDVPVAVQNSAKKLAGIGVIEAINPKLGDAGVVYEVVLSHEGERQTHRLNKDGEVIRENAP